MQVFWIVEDSTTRLGTRSNNSDSLAAVGSVCPREILLLSQTLAQMMNGRTHCGCRNVSSYIDLKHNSLTRMRVNQPRFTIEPLLNIAPDAQKLSDVSFKAVALFVSKFHKEPQAVFPSGVVRGSFVALEKNIA
jgi:hypothetical protein